MPVERPSLLKAALAALTALALGGCATVGGESAPAPPVEVQILAINDFHGNLEIPPGTTTYITEDGPVTAQLGGAARLGATLAGLRQGKPNSITVAAGDLIGASPLVSAYYLDEPTILALNRARLEIAAVGNHEFDKGVAELRRMQDGGCNGGHPVGGRRPCRLDPSFAGANFKFLAANVIGPDGRTLFPASHMTRFGGVKVGFVGMTLKETGTLTSPEGTAGYRFEDEAATANAEAARLRAAGADTVVLLIHQGAHVERGYHVAGCPGLDGALLPILQNLDPAIRTVVSGHTHRAYACKLPARDGSQRLVTSAGRYGFFVTEIRLAIDPASDAVVAFSAANRPVEAAAGEQGDIARLVARYAKDVGSEAAKVVGRIEGSLEPAPGALYRPIDHIVADAHLAATQAPELGGAEFALMNSGGIRTTFEPAGTGEVTYGQIFALQPFGNALTVVELSGAELRAGLEAALARATPAAARQVLPIPSHNLRYSFDLSRAPGSRLVGVTLDGRPIEPTRTYRLAANNFIASGGDGFEFLAKARRVAGGILDLDALAAYLSPGVVAPAERRVTDVGALAPARDQSAH